MSAALQQMLGGAPGAWLGLGRGSQLGLLLLAVCLPVALFFGFQWMGDGQYVPVFASLTTEDAGTIVTQLKASKTPYRVAGNGEQVLVPADRVAEVRLRLASQGLPLGGGVGFEVFDKAAFGMSDFSQRLNYQRALQGELARTIGQLRPVVRARVHLVLPQPSVFTERERPASASVFLKLAPGSRLAPEQVRGIVHLVASSVEGLGPDRVTVVDTAGQVLSVGSDASTPGSPGALSPRRLEIRTAVEEGLERRVQTLLDSALGTGQAVTRVSAQINFDQVEKTEERFDPNPVVRQETRVVEKSKGTSSSPTLPTVQVAPAVPASPAPQTPAATTTNDGNRESESVSYEISRIVARTLTSPGEIQRLSVSVLLNTATRVTQPAAADKAEVRQPAPRTPEEIEKIRRVVMGAVGFHAPRGDEVTVVEMPFDMSAMQRERSALEGAGPEAPPRREWVTNQTVALAAIVLVAVLALVALLRAQSRRRGLDEVVRSLGQNGGAARPDAAPHVAGSAAPERAVPVVPEELLRLSREQEDLRQRALELANAEPQATAQLLRAWMVRKKSLQPAGGGRDAG